MKDRRPRGFWKDKKSVLKEIKRVMRRENWRALPAEDVLREYGHAALTNGIRNLGGYYVVRKLIGENQRRTQFGKRKDETYILAEGRRIMHEQKWKSLPSSQVIISAGYSSFVAAVCKYHGGVRNLRDLLDQDQLKVEEGAWKEEEFIFEYVSTMMKENGWIELPSSKVLSKKGYSGFVRAVQHYHCGFSSFRQRLAVQRGETTQDQSLLEHYVGENHG